MGQGKSLKNERNKPWFKPWFNISLHTQSIVCATVRGQRLEYLGCITLVIIWNENECRESCDNCDMFIWQRMQ